MVKPDRILSYHTNPALCGVAKFNKMLGERLGIPVYPLDTFSWGYPLLSIKTTELDFGDECDLIDRMYSADAYQLFLHSSDHGLPMSLMRKADIVYAANSKIAEVFRSVRQDIVSAWCPSLIEVRKEWYLEEIKVLSFGMAHKIQAEYYAKLDQELKETGQTYQLLLSTAFHEGFDVESEWGEAVKEIRKVFTGPVQFLGCLSDEAIRYGLRRCNYFAAFFPDGYRENNTSINAALEAGVKIVTNCDEYSPGSLVRDELGVTILKTNFRPSWKGLINLMEGKHEADNRGLSADRPCDVALD